MKNMYSRSLLKLQNALLNKNYLSIPDSTINIHASYPKTEQIISAIDMTQIIDSEINKKNGNKLFMSDLVRISDKELRSLLKIYCPISQIYFKNKKSSLEQIEAFKRLRNHLKISEEKTCERCPLFNLCPSAKKMQQDQKKAKLDDLLLFLYALNEIPESKYSILRWAAAYKVTQSLAFLVSDDKNIKKEASLYNALKRREQNLQNRSKKQQPLQENLLFKNRKYEFF